MSTPPPARELTLRNDRRSRRVLCMGHLTVGGSIYFSAGRSEVGKRDCRGIMRRIASRLTLLARECKGPLLPAALPSSTGLKPLSYTKRGYATLDFEERIYRIEL